jgi:hypothetical protein
VSDLKNKSSVLDRSVERCLSDSFCDGANDDHDDILVDSDIDQTTSLRSPSKSNRCKAVIKGIMSYREFVIRVCDINML